MNKLEAKNKAYLYATGKSPAPTTGSKADRLEGLCHAFYASFQTEPDMEWDFMSQDVSAGNVSATDTFELDTDIHFLSRKKNARVRVAHSDSSNFSYYHIVSPDDLHLYKTSNAVAYIGEQQIKFSKPFVEGTSEFGGEIFAPAVIKLDDLTSNTDEVLIPQPEYLPWRMAAQYALTDRQLNHLYDDLLAQANEYMTAMKKANSSASESTSSTGVDYFASMGNVGSGLMGDGGARTDTIF